MSRYQKTNITQLSSNEQAAIDAINKNLTDIQTAIEDTVSRSAQTPTHMTGDFDLNGKRIINAPAPTSDNDLVRRVDVVGDIATVQTLVNAAVNAADQAAETAESVSEILTNANVALVGNDLALGNNSKIKIVAEDKTNIDAVAGDVTNVNVVASNLSNIDAVNSNETNINTVAGKTTEITTVSTNISNVNSVASNISNVNAVAGNATNINAVNSNKTNIDKVAGDINKVKLVADDISNVNTVAVDISNVVDVANNSTNINTCASNISAITSAPTYAAQAKQWAIGDPSEPSGGSSKYWAERAHTYTEDVLHYDRITDCITEIPQDIDLSVDTLYLKLKSGSKVVYPNGFEQDGTTRKFTEVTIASDLTRTDTGTGTKLPVFYIVDENRILPYANTFSGSTAPTFTGQGVWYDTTNNLIKRSVDGGSTWNTVKVSFPLGLATNDGTGYTQISQVFNGCGYIGSNVSTVFALREVKGLIPNGRNTDGTLKNISFDRSSVSIATLSSSLTKSNTTFDVNISALVYNDYYYDETNNYNKRTSDDVIYNATTLAIADIANGVVTSFKIKQPFHSADYSDLKKIQDNYVTTNTTQTISGTKTFAGTNLFNNGLTANGSIFVKRGDNYHYFMDRTDLANNATTPTSTKYEILCNRSNNGTIVGQFLSCQDTSGNYITRMDVNSGVSGTQKTASLGVALDSSGNAFTTCPTPSSATDNSSKIATTAWVNNAKSMITGWGMPSFSAPISSLTGTAASNGMFVAKNNGGSGSDDATVTLTYNGSSTSFTLAWFSYISVMIPEGTVWSVTSGTSPSATFYPCLGG